ILSIPKHCLRHGRKKRRKLSTDRRGQIPNRVMITERPKEIETRSELGHYESDTVVGKDHQSGVVTHVERKTRYLFVEKLKETGSKGVLEATKLLFRNIPKEGLKTFTSDNVKEFSRFKEISKFLEIDYYFVLPHHQWERGTNENTNGLLRQYFPKGTDFNTISDKEIRDVVTQLRLIILTY
ncbi:MAG: IS30 family transposase, partial [Fusobacteria bacterium]|nr:IS30 family transposase [Fusobacteriota bacterium]